MKHINHIILAALSALSLASCASFSEKIIRDKTEKLTKENIKNIEGTYEIQCYDSYFKSRQGREIIQFKKPNRDVFVNYFTDTHTIDSTLVKKLVVDIKLISDKEIAFTYRHQDSIVNETVLGMKLRGNGMLHLKNRETDMMGVPLIYGNFEIYRSRIGLSKSNDLIINYVYHITGVALILFGDSRTTYSKRIIKDDRVKLTKETIHDINGTYEYQPFKSYVGSSKNISKTNTNIEELDFYIVGTRSTFKPKEAFTVDVKVISEDQVSFAFKTNNNLVFERTIQMKLRSNGLIYLKNKHVKVKGIPFVFGGITSSKMRIGLSKEGNLLLNYAHDRFASILIMAGGNSYNRCHHYKKINTLP